MEMAEENKTEQLSLAINTQKGIIRKQLQKSQDDGKNVESQELLIHCLKMGVCGTDRSPFSPLKPLGLKTGLEIELSDIYTAEKMTSQLFRCLFKLLPTVGSDCGEGRGL